MSIIFEPRRKDYAKPFQDMLSQYFLGKSFDSLDSALEREYEPGHLLSELFEVAPINFTIIPHNLPATLDRSVTEVDILWKNFGRLPVMKAKYIEP